MLVIFLLPLVLALQDNTSDLFELIYSDKMESPVTSTDDKCTHNTESNLVSVVTAEDDVSRERKEVQPEWQDEDEIFSDFMLNVNFTPAPHASLQPNRALEKKKQNEHKEMVTTLTTPLLDLLQQ